MVHDYIRDPAVLVPSLQAAHEFVPVLIETAARFCSGIKHASPFSMAYAIAPAKNGC
ncbi:hypothetical protein [Thermosynechococcus sp. OHK43]|uniref:hypothetical protein n=1 Tax=Thermosynechococcus sp. OHK43 TaxID=2763133 RepID=UPI0025D7F214|nr:hypothetical protein [Thermosynechococcus sp. OHK43]